MLCLFVLLFEAAAAASAARRPASGQTECDQHDCSDAQDPARPREYLRSLPRMETAERAKNCTKNAEPADPRANRFDAGESISWSDGFQGVY
jgi:hypothetical protein